MVGPVRDDERVSFGKKLRLGFVVLVGLSAALITLQTDAGALAFAGALVAGCLVGVVLVRIAFPTSDELGTSGLDDRKRR